MNLPLLIQGGMGVGVSGWQLARAVSTEGQLGVVAGTALATTFVRRLQLGDGGHLRRAVEAFPLADMAQRVFDRYFRRKSAGRRAFAGHALPAARSPRSLEELTVVASFAETFLAKADHPGEIGINLLEKIQLATLPTLFGSMLAGVDWVLMGAGIPRAIPGVLDRLSRLEPATLSLDVSGARAGEKFETGFDPSRFVIGETNGLRRPRFLAIVSSATLAMTLARKLQESSAGRARVFTDPRASPTGFPLKIVQLDETVADPRVYAARPKLCDLGYLRQSYRRPDGSLGYRCPGEPVEDYLEKGGEPEEIAGRKCVCNGLLATIGLGQAQQDGYEEPALVTAGTDVAHVAGFLPPGGASYTAADVVRRLLGDRAGAGCQDRGR